MKRVLCATEEDTRVKDTSDVLKEDFNYIVDGLYKLNRKGYTDDALSIIEGLSDAIEDAIQQIAGILES